jgi:hypothetical protein
MMPTLCFFASNHKSDGGVIRRRKGPKACVPPHELCPKIPASDMEMVCYDPVVPTEAEAAFSKYREKENLERAINVSLQEEVVKAEREGKEAEKAITLCLQQDEQEAIFRSLSGRMVKHPQLKKKKQEDDYMKHTYGGPGTCSKYQEAPWFTPATHMSVMGRKNMKSIVKELQKDSLGCPGISLGGATQCRGRCVCPPNGRAVPAVTERNVCPAKRKIKDCDICLRDVIGSRRHSDMVFEARY